MATMYPGGSKDWKNVGKAKPKMAKVKPTPMPKVVEDLDGGLLRKLPITAGHLKTIKNTYGIK